MQRKLLIPGALAAMLALAACSGDGTTGPGGTSASLSATDAKTLAGEFGDQDGAMLDGMGGPSFDVIVTGPQNAVTATTTFTRTRTCPKGGDVKLAGTMTRTWDASTKSGSMAFDATRTEESCAFDHSGVTITVNGNPSTHLTANQTWTNGAPGVRTATKVGSFTWSKSTGQSGTCNINVTHTWDPSTKTLHVSGQLCNQTVDITRTWTQS